MAEPSNPTTPARNQLQWEITPDIYLARREATRARFLTLWIQSFEQITDKPTRLLTVLSVMNRYQRNVQRGLETLQRAGSVLRAAATHETALESAPSSQAGLRPARRWWRRPSPAPLPTPAVEEGVSLARQVQEAEAVVSALQESLTVWAEISTQHDEVALLMSLLDHDLGPLLAAPVSSTIEPTAPSVTDPANESSLMGASTLRDRPVYQWKHPA